MRRQAKPIERWARTSLALGSLLGAAALLAPAGAGASWPGQRGAIVFEAYRLGGEEAAAEEGKGIWSSPGAGVPFAQVRRLTRDPSDADPQVSPDGRWIVFSRGVAPSAGGEPTASAIFRMRSDGGALAPVTDGLHSDGRPVFLASGKRILFQRDGLSPTYGDLYSIGVDGTGLRQVTSGSADDRNPAASADGRTIAFERGRHIFTARPSGAEPKDITPQLPRSEAAHSPDFSPSGDRIAFARQGNVFITSANGKGPRRVTGFSFPRDGLGEPAYAPDGKSILAVYTSPYRSSSLYLYRARDRRIVNCVPVHLHLQIRAPAWGPSSQGRGC
jgi:Tol biopolymer transport system component